MKELAELLPFDEGTMVLEVSREALPKDAVRSVETIPPATAPRTSHLKLVDEGFSYNADRNKKGWGRLIAVFSLALAVVLSFSGAKREPTVVTASKSKPVKASPQVAKKSLRRHRRR